MSPYTVLISIEILQLGRLSRSERDKILSFLENLAENSNHSGDYQELDSIGRPVQINVIGEVALTYWADHAVKEIKVVRVEKADRR